MKKSIAVLFVLALSTMLVPAVYADGGCSNATLNGTYGGHTWGFYNVGKPGHVRSLPQAIGGAFTFDGAGNWTDKYTASANGHIAEWKSDKGTYTVNSDCTGSLQEASGSYHWDFEIVANGTKIYAIETDKTTIHTGVMEKQ